MKTVLFWLAIVFVLSVYPETKDMPLIRGSDKVFHFLLYAVTCALFYVELKKPLRLSLPLLLVLSVVLASAYGLLMEIVQGTMGTREFSLYDALANMLGAVAAAVFIAVIRRGK
jgi:VanZ family protein